MKAGETTCMKTRCVVSCPVSSSASQRGVVLTLHFDGTGASNSLNHCAQSIRQARINFTAQHRAASRADPEGKPLQATTFQRNFVAFLSLFISYTVIIHLFCGPGLPFSRNAGNFSTKAVSCHHFVLHCRPAFHATLVQQALTSFCVGTADRRSMLRWCNKHFPPIPDQT